MRKPSVVRVIMSQTRAAATKAASTPRCSRVPSTSTGRPAESSIGGEIG
jgi:hypothetical protein